MRLSVKSPILGRWTRLSALRDAPRTTPVTRKIPTISVLLAVISASPFEAGGAASNLTSSASRYEWGLDKQRW